MASAKWIVGFLGWAAFGPIGALLGYLVGAALDRKIDDFSRQIPGGGAGRGQSGGG